MLFLFCDTMMISKGTDDSYVCCREVRIGMRIELEVSEGQGKRYLRVGWDAWRNVH